MACPFCNPKESGNTIIAENEYAYVIHDKHPIVEGHLLVIPKRHYETIVEMDEKTLCGTMLLVREMEKRLMERVGVKGLTLRQNWHPFLKEDELVVRHVHFHIIPREYNDKMASGIERIELSNIKKNEIAKKLR